MLLYVPSAVPEATVILPPISNENRHRGGAEHNS